MGTGARLDRGWWCGYLRRSAKGATCRCIKPPSSWLFQSTPPRRERHLVSGPEHVEITFQSALPRRERRKAWRNHRNRLGISIHAPAKGATRVYSSDKIGHLIISIHAPVKGATWGNGDARRAAIISIHAPAKGATRPRPSRHTTSRHFNPRSRFVVENQPVEYIKIDGRTCAFQSAQRA